MNTHLYFDLLGIDSHADKNTIKKAYRKKAFEFHPDLNKSPQAAAIFIRITEAYEYLMNEKSHSHEETFLKNTYADKMQAYHVKAKKMAEMDFEAFQKECEAFQSSRYYFFGVAVLFLFGVVYILGSAVLICLPLIVAVKTQTFWFVFALLPLALAGVFLFWNAFQEQSFWNQYLRN